MRDLDFDFLKGLPFIIGSDLAKRCFRIKLNKSGAPEHNCPLPFCRVKEGLAGQKAPGGSSHGREFSHELTVCLRITHAAFCNVGGRMM